MPLTSKIDFERGKLYSLTTTRGTSILKYVARNRGGCGDHEFVDQATGLVVSITYKQTRANFWAKTEGWSTVGKTTWIKVKNLTPV